MYKKTVTNFDYSYNKPTLFVVASECFLCLSANLGGGSAAISFLSSSFFLYFVRYRRSASGGNRTATTIAALDLGVALLRDNPY